MAENTANPARTFESSLDRLTAIVKELEGEGVDLERSVQLFQEGRTLVTHCEALLKNAETTLRAADGNAAGPATIGRAVDDEQPF
jgi:exodeoxyribonuclease VII small subunit